MPHEIVPSRQKANAQRLRRDMTDVERKLWYALRDGRLSGVKFRRQVPLGPYIVDFASHAARLVIELDGSQHAETSAVEKDLERDTFLSKQGYKVLRFWNIQINLELNVVIDQIHWALPDDIKHRLDRDVLTDPSSGLRPPSPTRGEGP